MPDRQKARLRSCLAAIPRERWSSDAIALQYGLQCPTGYTRHSFFSCELKDGGKFDYLPGKEAAPGFVRLCRCLEDILPWKEAESEPGFGSGCSVERSERLKRGYDDMTINYDPKNMTKEQLQAVADKMYPGIALFARDVNLPEELARKYVPGLLIREKAFTDASSRFMGMVTTHRYVILSNHMADLSQFEHVHWGLHAAQKDSHFKVLGRHTHEGKTGIFLLHLPDDESWRLWQTAEFAMDRQLYDMAVQRFSAKCTQSPVPELTAKEWLDRCAFPVGMSNEGQFWPLEDAPEEKAAVPPKKAERPAPPPLPSDPREAKHSRYLGCLLGGAVGDALGFPIEFMKESYIWEKYGPKGIKTLAQAGHPALISDDTQMTLFAANAIIVDRKQKGGDLRENLWTAYREWLGTQGEKERMDDPEHPKMWVYREPRMHALRAPGNSCMNAIRHSPHGGTIQEPVNNSKGCGTVMRAAPFGLAVHCDPIRPSEDGFIIVYRIAACDAALTHGHRLAWTSSSMLAQIIYYIVQKYPEREYGLEQVIPHVNVPGGDENAYKLLMRAVKLARDPAVSDLDGIHALGEGWVAEEALAIAVFCAVRYQDDFAAAIRAAVNHKGDSDSTGAICGNILGAWLGKAAVEAAFDLENLELRDVIEKMANQLFEAVEVPAEEKPEVHTPKTPPAAPEPPKAEPLKPLRPVGMLYTPLTKHAMAICFDTHKNQFDKSGLPYVFHPFHLAEQMETEYEVCAALLHDVIEDSNHTPGELSQAGFPDEVVRAVRALTRDPHMHYLDYVARLRQNPIARRVKLADLAHNSDLNRLDSVTAQDRRRVLKYRMAQAILEDDRYDKVLEHFRKVLPLSMDDPLFLSVFYDRQGVVQEYSIDIEKAEDSHYEFDARQGEKLRLALDPSRTLPEALADWAEEGCSCFRVESMLRQSGIAFQPFHYD